LPDVVERLRARGTAWIWLVGLAFTCGVALILIACTVHDRCSNSDPACIFHSYTLVHTAGPAVLGFVGAPAVISLLLAMLLRIKVTRRSVRAARAAWFFTAVSCLICFVGLAVEGFPMILEAVLTVWAVAATPFPPDPDDPLVRAGGHPWRLPPPH
jgi:cytochrome bd-type quinol oxidase subunit 2